MSRKAGKPLKSDNLLFHSVATLIEQSRQHIAVAVNTELISLYWKTGKIIRLHILQNKRAGYGEQTIAALAQQLTETYGTGWGEKHLNHCLRSAETFTEKKILYAVRRQLSWTHLRTIMYLKDSLEREFYFEMCIHERWSTRQLQERIDSMLYYRTAISKKPDALIRKELTALRKEGKISTELVFRDPYFLDFLGLKDTYSEKDVENAIIAELQRFMIELGTDFAFLVRQKRIIIDNEDYYIDLLFYNRKLRRLVAIDLKLTKFRPADKAQMELYLKWLTKHEKADAEEPPIGLILCTGKSQEHIELLELDKGNIRVAQYFTELPPKKLLGQKLHKAWLDASARFQQAEK